MVRHMLSYESSTVLSSLLVQLQWTGGTVNCKRGIHIDGTACACACERACVCACVCAALCLFTCR